MAPVSSHSLAFFPSTPTAFAITPRPSSPGMQLPIFLFFPPPLHSFHLTSKCEIWISVCVSEGTASCELQIFGQHGNLFEMTNQAEQFVKAEHFL